MRLPEEPRPRVELITEFGAVLVWLFSGCKLPFIDQYDATEDLNFVVGCTSMIIAFFAILIYVML